MTAVVGILNKKAVAIAADNPTEIQQVEPPFNSVKLKDITVQSTPKEISNFVTQKLVEFIDQELKGKTDFTEKNNK